jgi:hypothetical protein
VAETVVVAEEDCEADAPLAAYCCSALSKSDRKFSPDDVAEELEELLLADEAELETACAESSS